MTRPNRNNMQIAEISYNVPLELLVLFDHGEGDLVRHIADVLGQSCNMREDLQDFYDRQDCAISVTGVLSGTIEQIEDLKNCSATILMTHCLDLDDTRDENVTSACDYEYLYSYHHGDIRRDITRYLGFILGQVQPQHATRQKERTFTLSLSLPQLSVMLPDLTIMSIGADAIELRIDALQNLGRDQISGIFSRVRYIGEQVAQLRQSTELPILFTYCGSRDDTGLSVDVVNFNSVFLNKARQWGCEYFDAQSLRLENVIGLNVGRDQVVSLSRFSCQRSGEIANLTKNGTRVHRHEDFNKVEEPFLNEPATAHHSVPFLFTDSRHENRSLCTPNQTFVSVTHSLLPSPAASGQLTIPEVNSRLCSKGQLFALRFYAIGNMRQIGLAAFLEKYFNELNSPHEVICLEHTAIDWTAHSSTWYDFGGAYFNPPLPVDEAHLPEISAAVRCIGQVDIVTTQHAGNGQRRIGDNVSWRGIRSTLTQGHVPSAYAGRAALVIASTESQASAAIYALMDLRVRPIYTIGFVATGELETRVKQLHGIGDLKGLQQPFVVMSALAADKSFATTPLLKHLSSGRTEGMPGCVQQSSTRKVYVDLADGGHGPHSSVSIAIQLGWRAYGVADVNAWRTVETLRLLVGQNVTFDFVRLAAGHCLTG